MPEYQNSKSFLGEVEAASTYRILGASHMAFRIDQAAIGDEETARCLQQKEMLPDVACIARMPSVIVMAHMMRFFSLLVHLLGDVECLGGRCHRNPLSVVE
jgi:hypothetical protein